MHYYQSIPNEIFVSLNYSCTQIYYKDSGRSHSFFWLLYNGSADSMEYSLMGRYCWLRNFSYTYICELLIYTRFFELKCDRYFEKNEFWRRKLYLNSWPIKTEHNQYNQIAKSSAILVYARLRNRVTRGCGGLQYASYSSLLQSIHRNAFTRRDVSMTTGGNDCRALVTSSRCSFHYGFGFT